MANTALGITLRDLPGLASTTHHVLLANVCVANLVSCTLVKTVLSIYVGYAFLTDKGEVDLRTLRAIRVLRPLKLVSGVPSRS